MNPEEYIELADRTSSPTPPVTQRLLESTWAINYLKLAGEDFIGCAERLDEFKKFLFYGKDLKCEEMAGILAPFSKDLATSPEFIELLHAAIGLATESGEILFAVLKALFDRTDVDLVNIHEELGDAEWYMAKAIKATRTSYAQVMASNIAKLKVRYPDKFTEKDAAQRDLFAERESLEASAVPKKFFCRICGESSIHDAYSYVDSENFVNHNICLAKLNHG